MIKQLLCTVLLLGSLSASAQYSNQKIKVGDTAPELSFSSPEGKTISLKALNKKRYILVDFWASWCGPCRRANPSLVRFYTNYAQRSFTGAKKGFEILSVSLDNNKEAWVAAIQKDSLYWRNHISDLKAWKSEAADIYGVQFIPQAFLIDPQGKIIGTYLTADQAIPDIERLVSTQKRKKFLGIF